GDVLLHADRSRGSRVPEPDALRLAFHHLVAPPANLPGTVPEVDHEPGRRREEAFSGGGHHAREREVRVPVVTSPRPDVGPGALDRREPGENAGHDPGFRVEPGRIRGGGRERGGGRQDGEERGDEEASPRETGPHFMANILSASKISIGCFTSAAFK